MSVLSWTVIFPDQLPTDKIVDLRHPGEAYIRDYYAFGGEMAEQVVQSILSTPEEIKEAMQAYEGIGADELILWPTVANLDQIDRLADVVG